MPNLRQIILVSFVILIALTTVACGAIPPAVTPTPENTPLPSTPTTEGAIDVGGYKLIYQCFGQGSPTVIVEAGGGDRTGSLFYLEYGHSKCISHHAYLYL